MNNKLDTSKNQNRDSSFQHLTHLLALLSYPNSDSTLISISNILNLPIQQIRQDFLALLSIKELSELMECYPGDSSIPDNDPEITFYLSDKKKWSKQLLYGKYDEYIFKLDSYTLNLHNETAIPLWLNQLEYSHLAARYPKLFNSVADKLRIKKEISTLNPIIKERADIIETAIESQKEITFFYNGILQTNIFPQFLYHDTNQNLIYCVDNTKTIYRLDRIFSKIKLSTAPSSQTSLSQQERKICDYMWGMANFNEAPVDVCVKIYHDTNNILNKIKADTSQRKYARIEAHDGFSYYYDTIIGINNFKVWLRSYGSSLIVLHPDSLAQEMKESAKKTLELYSTDNLPSWF